MAYAYIVLQYQPEEGCTTAPFSACFPISANEIASAISLVGSYSKYRGGISKISGWRIRNKKEGSNTTNSYFHSFAKFLAEGNLFSEKSMITNCEQ